MSKYKPNLPLDQTTFYSYDNLSDISVPSESMMIYAEEEYGTSGLSNNDVYIYVDEWHSLTKYRIIEQNISGDVTINLSTGNFFKLTITANVTSFSFSNATVGRQYIFLFKKYTTNKSFVWATGKYYFPFGNAPVLTNPTTNGSSPAYSEDIVTAICREPNRLDIVLTPDMQPN